MSLLNNAVRSAGSGVRKVGNGIEDAVDYLKGMANMQKAPSLYTDAAKNNAADKIQGAIGYLDKYTNKSAGNSNDSGGDYRYVSPYSYTTYGSAPKYGGSEWDTIAQNLGKQYANMNYDEWAQGDSYNNLAQRYTKAGNSAMLDTLAQIAGRTGGLASSYAAAASQQQYNDYMERLQDAAQAMYNNERNDLGQRVSLAQNFANDAYSRWLDDYNRQMANRRTVSGGGYYVDNNGNKYGSIPKEQETADTPASPVNRGDISFYDYEQGITSYGGKKYENPTALYEDVILNDSNRDSFEKWLNALPDISKEAVVNEIERKYPKAFSKETK